MAAIVHGCGSPRQHQENNIGIASSGGGGCLTGSHHHHQTATPMYSGAPKYPNRSSTQSLNSPKYQMYAGSSSQCTPTASQSYMQTYATNNHRSNLNSAVSASEACRNYWNHPHAATMMYRTGRHHNKRKSAVELLAETKNLYIKSDAVMERLQQSSYCNQMITSGSKRGRNVVENREPSLVVDTDRRFVPTTHITQGGSSRSTRIHSHNHHHNHNVHLGRHNYSANTGGNNYLQSKHRAVFSADSPRDCTVRTNERYRNELPRQYDQFGSLANNGSGNFGKEVSPMGYTNESSPIMKVSPLSVYVAPHSYDNAYNFDVENSSGEELILTENYRPISPPAEYAADTSQEPRSSRYNYQRSYSHSNEVADENAKYNATAYNINSHKSLPDLHSHISRHSPHSEVLSCCSRGNRSIKSTGESSLNRDSGGSSGHYTHRSEPCYRQRDSERDRDREIYDSKKCCNITPTPIDLRRDSGSSTQHSANSYCGYPSLSYGRNSGVACNECHYKSSVHFESSDYLFNFTTPEVPEAFQDDYTPPSQSVTKYKATEEPRSYTKSASQPVYSSQAYSCGMQLSKTSNVQSPSSAPSVEEISPPPIQFKRQRCIRFKNRSRISLPSVALHVNASNEATEHHTLVDASQLQELDNVSQLEKFFDRLGLTDDQFHEIYTPARRRRSNEADSDESSTVFFSDVSTVDSMRLPDSTEAQTTQIYRPSEPPSIVERNARIIKWLCNCRKMQYT